MQNLLLNLCYLRKVPNKRRGSLSQIPLYQLEKSRFAYLKREFLAC